VIGGIVSSDPLHLNLNKKDKDTLEGTSSLISTPTTKLWIPSFVPDWSDGPGCGSEIETKFIKLLQEQGLDCSISCTDREIETEFLKLSQQQLIEEVKKKEQSLYELSLEFEKLRQAQIALLQEKEGLVKDKEASKKDKEALEASKTSLEKEKHDLQRKVTSLERQSSRSTGVGAEQAQQRLEQQVKLLEQQMDLQKQDSKNQQQILQQEMQRVRLEAQTEALQLRQDLDKYKREAAQERQEAQRAQALLLKEKQEADQQKMEAQRLRQEMQQLKSFSDSQGRGNDEFIRIQKQKETELRAQITRLTSENSDLNQRVLEARRSQTQSAQQKVADLERDKLALDRRFAELQKTYQIAIDQVRGEGGEEKNES
jgi:hypothetical protein